MRSTVALPIVPDAGIVGPGPIGINPAGDMGEGPEPIRVAGVVTGLDP
jgi:hypothetical protein